MQYPMMFERFIDPQRSDLPDIDIDFEDERRHEVLNTLEINTEKRMLRILVRLPGTKVKIVLTILQGFYRIPKWAIDNIKSKLGVEPEGHQRSAETIQDTIDTYPEVKTIVKRFPRIRVCASTRGQYQRIWRSCGWISYILCTD